MTVLEATAAMTTEVDYGYPDPETAATATARGQFNGVVFVDTAWEVQPVTTVLQLEQLAPGWDGHGAPPIRRGTGDLAISLVRQIGKVGAENIPQPFVGPAGDGGITIEFQVGQRELAFAAHGDGTLTYLKGGAGEPFDGGDLFFHPAIVRGLIAWLTSPVPPA